MVEYLNLSTVIFPCFVLEFWVFEFEVSTLAG